MTYQPHPWPETVPSYPYQPDPTSITYPGTTTDFQFPVAEVVANGRVLTSAKMFYGTLPDMLPVVNDFLEDHIVEDIEIIDLDGWTLVIAYYEVGEAE